MEIIANRILIGCDLILADIASDDDCGVPSSQPLHHFFGSLVVESHAVDQGIVSWQTKQAWLGIAFLWLRGYGAYFDESKSHISQLVAKFCVLVETSSQTDGIFEFQSKNFSLQVFAVGIVQPVKNRFCKWYLKQNLHECECETVGLFRRKPKQQWANYRFVHAGYFMQN